MAKHLENGGAFWIDDREELEWIVHPTIVHERAAALAVEVHDLFLAVDPFDRSFIHAARALRVVLLHERGEAFAQPRVAPPLHGEIIAVPLVAKLMRHQPGGIGFRLGPGWMEYVIVSLRRGRDVFHAAE